MAILQEMSKDPDTRTKFRFVAIPRDAKTREWSEKEAVPLWEINTFWRDWDGGGRLSGFNQATREAMECLFRETFPDADPMDEAPVPVLAAAKLSTHAIAMVGPNATKTADSWVNIHPRRLTWKDVARTGFFCYDEVKRIPTPLTENNVKALEQAFENAQTAASDTGLDKPGGHLFIKKFKANLDKFRGFIGRDVKWEYRLVEAS